MHFKNNFHLYFLHGYQRDDSASLTAHILKGINEQTSIIT